MLIKLKEDQLDPFDQGWVANKDVKDQSHNPYPPGTYEYEEWEAGWIAYRDYRPTN